MEKGKAWTTALALCAIFGAASTVPCASASSAGQKSNSGAADLPEEMCKISVNDPHPACAESSRVIKTLKHMAELLSRGDFKGYSEYLADGCTTFDEATGKLIVGKEAVLADMKRRITENNPDGKEHMLTLTIEDPYAKVTGDVAVVTFKAIKQVGGAHPDKEEISATDVFVKRGNKWQKLHFRGEWKKIS